MIAEIGHIFLIIAFVLSLMQLITSIKVNFISFSELNYYALRKTNYIISLFLVFSFL